MKKKIDSLTFIQIIRISIVLILKCMIKLIDDVQDKILKNRYVYKKSAHFAFTSRFYYYDLRSRTRDQEFFRRHALFRTVSEKYENCLILF